MTVDELRKTNIEGLLRLCVELGLNIEGLETRSAAITRLMQNAYEVE